MAEVGKNMKKIRKEKKLTQEDLAERLHCTRQTISNYETGKSEPNIAVLVDIAETLEVDRRLDLWSPKEGKRKAAESQSGDFAGSSGDVTDFDIGSDAICKTVPI